MKKSNKNKVKTNPMMVGQKNIKGLKIDSSNEENEFRTFIIIIVIIAVLIGIIYGTTELLKKDDNNTEESIVSGVVNYDKVTIGTLLNRPYNEYYVLIYNADDSKAVLYSTMLSNYMSHNSEKDYIKIYFCDLANQLNSKYYNVNDDNKSNPSAKKISELDLSDLTLIKVENGKIASYIENYDQIKKILK